jgi:(E)-4-hydroxy-3-methylbut-2-enyl-diphosphate synthase
VGSEHPIRVQSMTTPSTQDTAATVEQVARLVDPGCEIVRLTVPTTRDAENLPNIRRELERRSVRVPLVADIHFTPAAAMKAIEYVDKIRVNPGNYADKKKFNVREYTDAQYRAELERIEEVFSPLVLRARELGVSMRIGTNHGSLSDRIMNRYGDTPEGMVESALEFVRICEAHDYRELILSMKASNPVVVTQVYRLLAERMADEGMDYPFHLGVTEAGDGEDGRVKSALGIGSLLDEGIGDTVRVSLTEDPVAEIPVARALVERYNRGHGRGTSFSLTTRVEETRDPFRYSRRVSRVFQFGPHTVGGAAPVLVEVPLLTPVADVEGLRRELDGQAGVRVPEETRAEVVSVGLTDPGQRDALGELKLSMHLVARRVALSARIRAEWLTVEPAWFDSCHRLELKLREPMDEAQRAVIEGALRASADESKAALLIECASPEKDMEQAVELALEVAELSAASGGRLILALTPCSGYSPLHAVRLLVARLDASEKRPPILLLDRPAERDAHTLLAPSAALGGLLCDGIGDAIRIDAESATESRRLAFGVLQAARVRITKTEFISCPSCGRTLFDLEETTARIKSRTAHLKGVKIAVMGCVVNGPGESKHADLGISLPGKGEDPKSPVYIDGKLATILQGPNIASDFIAILNDYVSYRFSKDD